LCALLRQKWVTYPVFCTIYIVINVASNNDIVTCIYTLRLSMMYIE
jgi:hypothetical protein